jgi:uncharacterized heparinase superfamily protein
VEKLWRYNQHYFDDLDAEGAGTRAMWHRALLLRWLRENPPGKGTGWEPYPTSLRIVNWIKWALGGAELPPECLQSLAVQTRWLSRNLEYHLLANHLFANAKALVFAGLFFQGPEADGWLDAGMDILRREVPEQILPDGGQFERSPMYHSLALEDMLDLLNVVKSFDGASARWRSDTEDWARVIESMRAWLRAMCHPDGQISYFNDAAVGIAPSPGALESYAARLGCAAAPAMRTGATHLAHSGYVRVDRPEAVALMDVGPVGPDYMPGHGHADTLSFELSLFGHRVFVNSGTSCYGTSDERLRQRGTAAHNTLVVDGQNSSEVWSGFRVARRAQPVRLSIHANHEIVVSCAHDGYRRLPGRPEHSRRWSFGDACVVIEDTVTGRFANAQARFHLHPAVALSDVSDGGTTIILPNGRTASFSVTGGVLRAERTTWHPEFGVSEANWCLVVELRGSVARASIGWGSGA